MLVINNLNATLISLTACHHTKTFWNALMKRNADSIFAVMSPKDGVFVLV